MEQAYNDKNLDAAIACKDFKEEAKMMLTSTSMPQDAEIVQQMAEVLELSFVNNLEEHGFPDFTRLQSAFIRERVDNHHYIITEICWFPDGGKSIQKLNVFKSVSGWKVLGPINED